MNFERFTQNARRVLQFAQEEAQRFNHNYIGTEHFLLGLVRVEEGVAARVLNGLGIELHKVRSAVEFVIGRGDHVVKGEIGLTPRAKRVIELAVDEARRLKHDYIGTEHLLLGLVREGEGIAAGILVDSLGVSLEKVGTQVMEALGVPGGYTLPARTRFDAAIDVVSDVRSGGRRGTAVVTWTTHPTARDENTGLAIEMVRTLFDYSIWARDQLLPAIEALEEAQVRSGEQKGVYGSIHDTLAHLAVSKWMWLRRAQGESPTHLPKGEDFPNLPALLDWWSTIHAEAVQHLAALNDEDLNREVTYTGPDGKTRTRKVWHMLLQVVNHQTEHRSQIATMLGQLGGEVPQTDLVVYLSQRG